VNHLLVIVDMFSEDGLDFLSRKGFVEEKSMFNVSTKDVVSIAVNPKSDRELVLSDRMGTLLLRNLHAIHIHDALQSIKSERNMAPLMGRKRGGRTDLSVRRQNDSWRSSGAQVKKPPVVGSSSNLVEDASITDWVNPRCSGEVLPLNGGSAGDASRDAFRSWWEGLTVTKGSP